MLGIAVIIINTDFGRHLESMPGLQKDKDVLVTTLENLGFVVKIIENENRDKTIGIVMEIRQQVKATDKCFACVIASHGDEVKEPNDISPQDMIYTKNQYFVLQRITELFNCENCTELRNKPKLFFISACRGKEIDMGVTKGKFDPTPPVKEYPNIPIYKDFILSYGVPPGFKGWCNKESGSWFIKFLCQHLKEANTDSEDLISILVKTADEIVTESTRVSHDAAGNLLFPFHQMPWYASMLTRAVYLCEQGGGGDNKKNAYW